MTVSHTRAEPLFVFAGGGTGGHLYPALGVVDAIKRLASDARFLFLGTDRPIDARIIGPTDCELVRQTLPPLRRAPWRWPAIYWKFRAAQSACRARFTDDRPVVVVGTGGLASVPAAREAARLAIPLVLFNPDAVPGKANRFLAGRADLVFAQFEETTAYLPHGCRIEVVGCPVRPGFRQVGREAGCAAFGLDQQKRTLLVTGASQGSRSVNQAVIANLSFLAAQMGWQMLHLTGNPDHEEVRRAYADTTACGVVLPFTDKMPEALAAADLVVARAGASFLAEIMAVGRASVLMPYPHHRDMHQRVNACCLTRVGAAQLVDDRIDPAQNGPALRSALSPLMASDASRLAMADAARRVGRPNAADRIAAHLVSLAE